MKTAVFFNLIGFATNIAPNAFFRLNMYSLFYGFAPSLHCTHKNVCLFMPSLYLYTIQQSQKHILCCTL